MLINCNLPIVLDSPSVVDEVMGKLEDGNFPPCPLEEPERIGVLLNLIAVHAISSFDEFKSIISPEITTAIGIDFGDQWEAFVFKLTFWQLLDSIESLGFNAEELVKWENTEDGLKLVIDVSSVSD